LLCSHNLCAFSFFSFLLFLLSLIHQFPSLMILLSHHFNSIYRLYQLITNSSLTPLYNTASHTPHTTQHNTNLLFLLLLFFFFVHHNHHPYGRNPASELQDLNGGAGNPTRRRTEWVAAELHGPAPEAPLHQSPLLLRQPRCSGTLHLRPQETHVPTPRPCHPSLGSDPHLRIGSTLHQVQRRWCPHRRVSLPPHPSRMVPSKRLLPSSRSSPRSRAWSWPRFLPLGLS